MKKVLFTIALVLLMVPVFSQAVMKFCFNTTGENGSADWSFNTITFDKDKSLKCVVYLPELIADLTQVTYLVQYQQNSGQPFIDKNSYTLDVKPDWYWFYYYLKFDAAGNYKVTAVDNKGNVLVESMLHLVL